MSTLENSIIIQLGHEAEAKGGSTSFMWLILALMPLVQLELSDDLNLGCTDASKGASIEFAR